MTGTTNKVIMVANDNPNIIVQASGPQNTTDSPPRKKCGLPAANRP